MEKDIGKIKKNEIADIIIRLDDFGGRVGLTIREFTTSDRYTGFTKSGTRIPAESIGEFKKMINSIDESEVKKMQDQTEPTSDLPSKTAEKDSSQKQLTEKKPDNTETTNNPNEEIKEEII